MKIEIVDEYEEFSSILKYDKDYNPCGEYIESLQQQLSQEAQEDVQIYTVSEYTEIIRENIKNQMGDKKIMYAGITVAAYHMLDFNQIWWDLHKNGEMTLYFLIDDEEKDFSKSGYVVVV